MSACGRNQSLTIAFAVCLLTGMGCRKFDARVLPTRRAESGAQRPPQRASPSGVLALFVNTVRVGLRGEQTEVVFYRSNRELCRWNSSLPEQLQCLPTRASVVAFGRVDAPDSGSTCAFDGTGLVCWDSSQSSFLGRTRRINDVARLPDGSVWNFVVSTAGRICRPEVDAGQLNCFERSVAPATRFAAVTAFACTLEREALSCVTAAGAAYHYDVRGECEVSSVNEYPPSGAVAISCGTGTAENRYSSITAVTRDGPMRLVKFAGGPERDAPFWVDCRAEGPTGALLCTGQDPGIADGTDADCPAHAAARPSGVFGDCRWEGPWRLLADDTISELAGDARGMNWCAVVGGTAIECWGRRFTHAVGPIVVHPAAECRTPRRCRYAMEPNY